MTEHVLPDLRSSSRTFAELLEGFAFIFLLVSIAVIVYFDDIQLTEHSYQDAPTIFNIRFMGIKLMDFMTIGLTLLCFLCLIFRDRVIVTTFHRSIVLMFLLYWYAGLVGFIYSLFVEYDYLLWIQDFQQILYFFGFFLLTFHLLNTRKKWRVFVVVLLVTMAAKNILIFYRTFHGIGIIYGDWAIRASQNSEFTYFPLMFFPALILFVKQRSKLLRIMLLAVIFVYTFNAFVGVVRTVWVMLGLGMLYLLYLLDGKSRAKIYVWGASLGACAILLIASMLPRFISMAFSYKFLSIFDWSVYGDRSNATRSIELINVFSYMLNHFSFLQGGGLGSWWDDSARRLLPDRGAGYMYKMKFYHTHLLVLTQALKLGIIATGIYWIAFVRIFTKLRSGIASLSLERWEVQVMLGLTVGILCGVISSADYVKLFLMIGISLGTCVSGIYLFGAESDSSNTV